MKWKKTMQKCLIKIRMQLGSLNMEDSIESDSLIVMHDQHSFISSTTGKYHTSDSQL